MAIWFQNLTVEQLNGMNTNNINGHLGIEMTEIGEDFVRGRMPVDQRTHQPFGILHGGASVVLAESLGSIASFLAIDATQSMGVGLEVNANHLRPVADGWVYGTARPVHVGRTSHVWDIRIENEQGKLVCISRLTTAIRPLPKE